MEKTNLGVVIPLDAEWSDVGSWQSLWENEDKDKEGNVIAGKVLVKNVKKKWSWSILSGAGMFIVEHI